MLNITDQKGNASQNYSEIPLYIHQGGHYFETESNRCWGGYGKIVTLVNCWYEDKCFSHWKTVRQFPQRIKNRYDKAFDRVDHSKL